MHRHFAGLTDLRPAETAISHGHESPTYAARNWHRKSSSVDGIPSTRACTPAEYPGRFGTAERCRVCGWHTEQECTLRPDAFHTH